MGQNIIKRKLKSLMYIQPQKTQRKKNLINELCILMNRKKIYTRTLIDPLSVMIGIVIVPTIYKLLELFYQTDGRSAIREMRIDIGGDSSILIFVILCSLIVLCYLNFLSRKDEKQKEERLIQEAQKQLDNPDIKAVLSLLRKE